MSNNHPGVGTILRGLTKLFLASGILCGLWSLPCQAASIKVSRRPDRSSAPSLTVEGQIMQGDALKLLEMYQYYGLAAASEVHLLSKGGDVEEAMMMGRLIRVLGLETWAPLVVGLPEPHSLVVADDKSNTVCASDCFLVWAGGASRHGDFLVLHRPYYSKMAARTLSDEEQESGERTEISKVRDYLAEMEVDPFYVNKVITTSSKDGYALKLGDLIEHPIEGYPPSIEEVLLSKCDVPPLSAMLLAEKNDTAEGRERWMQVARERAAGEKCGQEEFEHLQFDAWDKEHSVEVRNLCEKLSLNPSEREAWSRWYADPPERRPSAGKPAMLRLIEKDKRRRDCESNSMLGLSMMATAHSRLASPEDTLSRDFKLDPSELTRVLNSLN